MPATGEPTLHAPSLRGLGACLEPVVPLATHGLGRRYGKLVALDSLDLTVASGSVVGLVGPNGSGKTTALRLVTGLDSPDAGQAAVDGHPAGSLAARRSLAYVPDQPGGLEELTVGEFVDLVGALYGRPQGFDRRALLLLAAFGLGQRSSDPLAALSHGLRRQASIVAACALATPLLVVDEATAALDPEAVIVLREALRAAAARGGAALLATQDLSFAETVCDKVWLLARGRTVASGTLQSVLAQYAAPTLETAFLAAVGQSDLIVSVRESFRSL